MEFELEREAECSKIMQMMQSFLCEYNRTLSELYDADLHKIHSSQMKNQLQSFFDTLNMDLFDRKEKCKARLGELTEESQKLSRALGTELITFDGSLPLMVRVERFDASLVDSRRMYAEKKRKIDACLTEQATLCQELGEEPQNLSIDPLASDEQVFAFESYLTDLKAEKVRRIDEIEMLKQKIRELCISMELVMSQSVSENWSPKVENLNRLRAEVSQLEKQREPYYRKLIDMISKLKVMWVILDVPQDTRERWLAIATKCKQSSVEAVEAELKRCEAKKAENMKTFIQKLRDMLTAQWDKIHKSQEERNRFELFRSQMYTEDLYQMHELELKKCERFYEDNREIFEKFAERQILFEKKKALDAKQNEPGRYNNRGGQLLKEEKERKQLDTKIPKVENEIRALVEGYRQTNKGDFLINGQCILYVMEKEWEDYRGSKELLKSATKTIPMTPKSAAIAPKTPMSLRGPTTLKRMASTTSLALSTGNATKKRHVDSRASLSVKVGEPKPKRNLLNQLTSASDAVKPSVAKARPSQASIASKLPVPQPKRKSLTRATADKILKKYRRSSLSKSQDINDSRISGVSPTNESEMPHIPDELDFDQKENSMIDTNKLAKDGRRRSTNIAATKHENVKPANGTKPPLLQYNN